MTRADWIVIGMKLIGVYFAVLGFSVLIVLAVGIIETIALRLAEDAPYLVDPRVNVSELLQPIGYLLGAFFLIRRTQWCLKIVCPDRDDQHLNHQHETPVT